jgi:hypothetical protein
VTRKPLELLILLGCLAAVSAVQSASATEGSAPAKATAPTTVASAPVACVGPLTITSGGSYSGCWVSSDTSTPAVLVNTTEPVVISNSTVSGPGELVRVGAGANVTLDHATGNGGSGRFFVGENVKSVTIRNCTLNKTAGIYILSAQSGASIQITRNKEFNVQSDGGATQFAQFDKVTTATIDVSWNEVVNTFGQSAVEDVISLHQSAFAKVHNNYIQGAYPATASAGFSGSGVMVDGVGAHDNEIYSNQIVETTNAGIGISAGWNNKAHDNSLVFDGKLPDGTPLAAANVGIYVWNSNPDPDWSNNQTYGNTVGWVNSSGVRKDWWLPDCSGKCSNHSISAARRPTHRLPPISHATEVAEWTKWNEEITARGVQVGVVASDQNRPRAAALSNPRRGA